MELNESLVCMIDKILYYIEDYRLFYPNYISQITRRLDLFKSKLKNIKLTYPEEAIEKVYFIREGLIKLAVDFDSNPAENTEELIETLSLLEKLLDLDNHSTIRLQFISRKNIEVSSNKNLYNKLLTKYNLN